MKRKIFWDQTIVVIIEIAAVSGYLWWNFCENSHRGPSYLAMTLLLNILLVFFLILIFYLWQKDKFHSQNLQLLVEERTAELKKSEERYKNLFENSKDLVYTLNLDGGITSVNEMSGEFTGYSQEELIGKELQQLASSVSKLEVDKVIKEIQATGSAILGFPMEIITKDGSARYFETSIGLVAEHRLRIGHQVRWDYRCGEPCGPGNQFRVDFSFSEQNHK
jgi:PAS domain S-box-containing protein